MPDATLMRTPLLLRSRGMSVVSGGCNPDHGPGMHEAHERRLIGKFAAHATVHAGTEAGLHRFIRCYVMPFYAEL